jgi:cyclophilin family peptidyl-prolyl cis-trans isomerase
MQLISIPHLILLAIFFILHRAQGLYKHTIVVRKTHQKLLVQWITVLGLTTTTLSTFSGSAFALTTVDAKVTSKVRLDFSVASSKPKAVTLGLFGEAAPESTKLFRTLCEGDLRKSIGYTGAQVSSIMKDESITINKFAKGADKKTESYRNEAGVVRLRSLDLSSDVEISDSNDLKHDVEGALSMQKGGGSFGFTISPKANEDLDEDNIVIGRVIGGMDVVKELNEIPVTRDDPLGSKTAFSSLGKGVDGRAKIASVNKPLKKIRIAACSVLS